MKLPSAPVLSGVAEPLYRAAVEGGRASLEVLAERAGLDCTAAADEVEVLAAIGLLEVSDEGIEAVAPRIPLEQVAAEHAKAADATRQLASVFAHIWSEAGDRSSFVEVITDEARCAAAEAKLMDDTAQTVDGLCIGPVSPRKVRTGMEIPRPGVAVGFFEAMERGVRARGLYGVSVLEDFEGLAAVHQCIAVGEQARVFAQVPLNLMLFDDKRALMSVPGQKGARRSLVIVHESGLLDSLAGLFEVFWQMGVPLSPESQVVDALGGPGSDEQQLLSYLAAGLTDEAIARDLGVSARTVGRRIARLEEVLGAHSRFQLAIQASRRGWI
ncbi:helix-turn-helix transcriptional regulator [Kribbella monticola]|uniref:helix-turn-helix transcriptional regulator n=1 Tax=Kribbella monticola TaxID=2185285 RepID=UPI000DD3D495|nr:helix-turn-helix transcriptional regulator [Kribbella monticola]